MNGQKKQVLRGRLSAKGVLRGRILATARYDPYDGICHVEPSNESRVLETRGKVMLENVVVEPIPSNYGLITWNGSTLTVS